jgi:hypothetical protein
MSGPDTDKRRKKSRWVKQCGLTEMAELVRIDKWLRESRKGPGRDERHGKPTRLPGRVFPPDELHILSTL